jgi:hypothetical protein
MKISAAVLLAASALALAGPAAAKTSINKGELLCKAALNAQTPPPRSFRVDKDETRSTDGHIWFTVNARNADGVATKLLCTVDRATETAVVAPAA